MGKIQDALKKAEREREERRKSSAAQNPSASELSSETATESFRLPVLDDEESRPTTRQAVAADALFADSTEARTPVKGIARGLVKASDVTSPGPSDRFDEGLIAARNPADPRVERFRIIKTNMQVLKPEPRVFLMTSALESDGATVTAGNLAVIFAEDGTSRTLIIDANFRRPENGFRNMFGLPADRPGFSEVIQGRVEPLDVVSETGCPGVFFVGAGARPANPGGLISNPDLKSILGVYSKAFDRVIIDAPPVLGVPDSHVLGRMVDGAILVIRLAGTPRKSVEKAVETLASAGVRVVGSILTNSEIDEGEADGQ